MITTGYKITPEDRDMLDNRFEYHAPIGDQAQRYTEIRDLAREFAAKLLQNCPRSRELTIAIHHLEDVVYAANASIARNESMESLVLIEVIP